ncbi:MAG: CotH kinase family protein [Pseudomonadota bacterium]|nr:CotH kinase family protein [Pseudomonadota bacterium]
MSPIFLFLGGCSIFDPDAPAGPGPSLTLDSAVGDTGGETDTDAPDTDAPDSDAPDTGGPDITPVDSGPVDTAAPDTEDSAASEDDAATEADELFEEGTIHEFGLTLGAAAIASLAVDPSLDVPASFSYGGETYSVGIHIKGSHSLRTLDEKAAFKIDFNEFVPGQRFLGLEHLTLNNMVQDRSMLREHAAYWLYDQLGVPAPRHGFARVEVNGALFGLYGIVESMDQDFLARRFPDDTEGNLYETAHARGDVTWARSSDFVLQQAGTVPEGEDLDALADTVESATPDSFFGMLETVFDTDELLTFLALDIVMGHDDGYITSCNNYLLYNAPDAGQWHLVPWGQDQTFDEASSIYLGYEGQLAARCIASPECKTAFDGKLREVADLWESADLAGYVRAAAEGIEADCEADPRKEHECSTEALLEFIETRPELVRAQLP